MKIFRVSANGVLRLIQLAPEMVETIRDGKQGQEVTPPRFLTPFLAE